jgi:FG-GAP repeat protein
LLAYARHCTNQPAARIAIDGASSEYFEIIVPSEGTAVLKTPLMLSAALALLGVVAALPATAASTLPAGLRSAVHEALARDGVVQAPMPHASGNWTRQDVTASNRANDGATLGEQEVVASDGAQGDQFGISVAVDGDTALIGAAYENGGQGAAYVFVQSNGSWSEAQKLVASDGAANDWFGQSVALDGDTAVIGAPQYLNFGNGAAYVFTRSAGTWSESQKLTADDSVGRDQLGISVAVDGTDVLVGAYGAAFYQGAVYAFAESGGSWTQVQKLVADDASQNADFGVSVALVGSTALIGAYGDASYQGAAYVFGQAAGSWSQSQKLVASDGAANAHFGISVALDGSRALVGAEGATVGANSHQGEAYAFSNAGGTWTQTQQLVASNGVAWDYFGRSVALDGPNAIVGAYGPNALQGAAYLFASTGGDWSETQALTSSDGAGGEQYGIWVALSGSTALVGANGASAFQGKAYFYTLPAGDTIFANGFDP